jgi:hypothetical protein
MNLIKTVMFCGVVMVALLVGAGRAEANQGWGYPCYVSLVPPGQAGPLFGSAGYLSITFYSAPACGGTLLGGGYSCSVGATPSTYCDAPNLHTEAQLNVLFTAVMNAAYQHHPIYFAQRPNSSGFSTLNFSAN